MLLGTEFLASLAMLDQVLGGLESSRPEETMVESFGDKGSGGRVVSALALVYVLEDRQAFLGFHTSLKDSSYTAPDELSVYYRVGSSPAFHLPGRDLISWQLSVY